MTKIDIISGFLGAGKTTLIKKLVAESFKNEKVVLIENEFGEIGIDGGFLKDAGIEIREMNSGCICCSLVGDFGKSLKEVIEKYQPERIVIEPSGVGKLSDVMNAVADTAKELEVTLNSAVAVVDVVKCKMYMKNFGEFFNNQIESANAIILSRTGNVSQDKIETAVGLIREHNKDAHIITTPWDALKAEDIIKAMEGDDMLQELLKEANEHHHHHHEDGEECHCHDHEHHHHHEDGEECHCHDHEHHHHHHEDGEEYHCHDHEHHHHHHEDGEECHCHDHEHHHHHHHADDVFTSIGIETPKKYTKAQLEGILERLANDEAFGTILRAKGMVPDAEADTFLHFDLTPGEYEVRTGSPEYTGRVCVIGAKINEAEIKELFN